MEGGAALVGREPELEQIDRFLTEGTGMRLLLLEGEAGIGKTTLFEAAVARADPAALVLRSRPAPTEAQLSFAAASDLLAGRLCELNGVVPAAQLRVLEIAFRLGDPDEVTGLDPHSVSAAFLASLRHLAERHAVVVAIDDLQWLDESSVLVLQFALRRLADAPVMLIAARRTGSDERLAAAVGAALPGPSVRRIEVGPLSLGALHHLLRLRLGITYARPTIRRLLNASGGNPFYALELARAIERRGGVAPVDEPLPVPPTLAELVAERIDALSAPAAELLGFVAALSESSRRVVDTVIDRRALGGALDDAIAAGVLTLEGERIAFTHPLLASGVYGRLGPERRRAVHDLLAEIVSDAEDKAFHLALARSEPDEAVAVQLEQAASRARRRGALETASNLLEHAARLTPAEEQASRGRRIVAVAELLLDGGDPRRAAKLLGDALDSLPHGAIKGEALTLLGWFADDLEASEQLCRQALAEAPGDPRVGSRAHLELAVIRSIECRYADVVRESAHAAQLAEASGDVAVQALALAELGHAQTFLGHGVTQETRQAAELERSGDFTGLLSGGALLGRVLAFDGQVDPARAVLSAELERATAAGHESACAAIRHDLSALEAFVGNWEEADRLAHESSALAHQVSTEQMSAASLYFPALVDALLGRSDAAREQSLAGLESAERLGDVIFALKHRGVLGFVELSLGDMEAAHRWLAPAVEALLENDVRELSPFQVMENELDALAALGLVDEADAVVTRLEDPRLPQGSLWSRLVAVRGRALVQAARGELDEARSTLDWALALHEHVPNPFEHARTLLLRGALERRAKQKRAGKAHLDQALAIFEQLPAPLWADKARAELRRLSLRSTKATLTATEARIAELAASGLTNREIAAAAFVSQKTVEANLSKIYRKLAVRSRVELARHIERGS